MAEVTPEREEGDRGKSAPTTAIPIAPIPIAPIPIDFLPRLRYNLTVSDSPKPAGFYE